MSINQRIVKTIQAHGGRVDGAYPCPHHPDDNCECRKPRPGPLLQAADELDLDLSQSYFIGDAITDMQAAEAAGAQGILVLTGRGRSQARGVSDPPPWPIAIDLESAIDYILNDRA